MSEIQIQSAKDGNPVPLWAGFQLHSLYNPVKEGESLANKFLSETKDFQKPVIVFGLGFAYHILPILSIFESIWIAESNADLIKEAKALEILKPVFDKCKLIENVTETPYLSDFYTYFLRSEIRFQEKFFADVQESIKISDKEFVPATNQIRILVNSPVYGGSFTTAKYVESALKSLGTAVRFTDHSSAEPLLKKYLSNPVANADLIEQLTALLSETLWHDILDFKPHIVFFVAQSPFTDKLMKAVNKAGIVSIYWFVEDFRRLTYWKAVCNNFDYFFMIQKGDFEESLKRYCRSVWGWFPVAADSEIHKKVYVSEKDMAFYGSDISFMGAAYPNRIKFFKHFNKTNLKLWGTGWTESELSAYNIPLKEQRISIEQSNIIYQSSKININLHSSNSGPDDSNIFDIYGDFVNPRTFEIAACGGFQLVDDRESVRELFDVDEEIVLFSSVEEALDKASFYLKNEPLRKKIAQAAQIKVLKYHTYEIRLANMLNSVVKHSPRISSVISQENEKINAFLKLTNDQELKSFINSLDPGLRFSYEKILNEVNKSQGNLKTYEAFLMLLDTFYTGE